MTRPKPGDTVIVFFAGHGFLDARGQCFPAPQNCLRKKLGLTALRIEEFREMLHQCEASRKLLILDCCRSGGGPAPIRCSSDPSGDEGDGPEEKSGSLEQVPAPSEQQWRPCFRIARGLITLSSCRKNEYSYESQAKGQGLFT
jgi:hypothetical protein